MKRIDNSHNAPFRVLAPAVLAAAPAMALAAALALAAASCAAPIRIAAAADPLALLSPGSAAYARLSGPAARDIVSALPDSALPAAEREPLLSLLSRTRVAAIGLGSLAPAASPGDAPPGAEGAAPSGTAARTPPFEAAAIGDFPFRASALSLASGKGWKRERSGYYNAGLGLRAEVPGPGLLLAASGPLEPLVAAAEAPGPSPIPERLAALASSEIALWVPEPFAAGADALLGEGAAIPVRGLLVAARPIASEEGAYEATVAFLMTDAGAARTYRPLLRLAWYAIARSFFGEDAPAALAAPFATEGELYSASGIRITRERIAAFAASLARPLAGRPAGAPR